MLDEGQYVAIAPFASMSPEQSTACPHEDWRSAQNYSSVMACKLVLLPFESLLFGPRLERMARVAKRLRLDESVERASGSEDSSDAAGGCVEGAWNAAAARPGNIAAMRKRLPICAALKGLPPGKTSV